MATRCSTSSTANGATDTLPFLQFRCRCVLLQLSLWPLLGLLLFGASVVFGDLPDVDAVVVVVFGDLPDVGAVVVVLVLGDLPDFGAGVALGDGVGLTVAGGVVGGASVDSSGVNSAVVVVAVLVLVAGAGATLDRVVGVGAARSVVAVVTSTTVLPLAGSVTTIGCG